MTAVTATHLDGTTDQRPARRDSTPFVAMRPATRLGLAMAITLLPLVALMMGHDSPTASSAVVASAAAYSAVLAGTLLLPIRGFGWLHPVMVTVAFAVVNLVRSFNVISGGLDYHVAVAGTHEALNPVVAHQLQLSVLAMVSYVIGFYVSGRGRGRRRRTTASETSPVSTSPDRLLVLFWLISIAFATYVVSRSGGLDAHFVRLSLGRQSALAGQFAVVALATLALPVMWLRWAASPWSPTHRALNVAGALAATALAYVVTGTRALFVLSGLVFLSIAALRRQKISLSRIAGVVVVSVFLLSALGTFRDAARSGSLDFGHFVGERSVLATVSDGVTGEVVDRASTRSGAIAILAKVPQEKNHLLGSSYLAALVMPVPRTLWEGKPGQIDGMVGRELFGGPGGQPPSAEGEAYWNFGVAGVAVVFMLFGAFHAWLVRRVRPRLDDPAVRVLYAVTVIFFASPSSSAYVTWVLWAVPVLLLTIIIRRLGVRF